MRFPYFAVIWFVYMVLAGISMFEASGNFIILLILTVGAVIATGLVMENVKPQDQIEQLTQSNHEKAKRSAEPLNSSLLALLDDSDREILRQQIMNRLLDNIERSSDGELNTLEALLSEQNHRQRR